MSRYFPFRISKLSFLLDRKSLWINSVLLVFMLTAVIISLGIGQMKISPLAVVRSIFGSGTDMQNLVVMDFRMPRILLAVIAGAALSVSGAILQGMIRNPLASPDIIGITGGGAFATVAFLAAFSDRSNTLTVSIQWLPLASFLGAVGIALLCYLLSWKNGGVSPLRMVLIGIGLSAAMQALTNMGMILGPIFTASRANIWITGSVNGTNWNEIATAAPWFALLMVITFVYARRLNIQELGEDIAKNAGSVTQRDRFVLMILSAALAGVAVAFAGGIGFVGLLAPHIARRLVGSAYGALLPAAALVGSIVVILADLIARTAMEGMEIPAGVFTSAIGAPYFIYLLYKGKKN